jgi:hypothetical protein
VGTEPVSDLVAPSVEGPIATRYKQVKKDWPGRIFFLPLEGFFYSFEDDARLVAKVCGDHFLVGRAFEGMDPPTVALTVEECNQCLNQLMEAGYRVGVAEPELVRIIDPD